MTAYEKMLRVMRRQSKEEAETGVRTGVITAGGLRVGELELEAEDLLVAEHLLTGWMHPDGETASGALQEGDTVLCKKVSDTLYAVFARLVRLE